VPGHPAVRQVTDDGIDRAEFGLVPARVEQWHGWVFANVSGDAPPLAEQLGNADIVVDGYDAGRLVPGARHEYEVAANWKLIVENYLECYHCAPIHPELCEVTRRSRAPATRRRRSAAGSAARSRCGTARRPCRWTGAASAYRSPACRPPGPARSATRRCCRHCW
jgi:phenylpropionate dioxygenase-like ring-hydroxylating dioxygenase large terminal subunit